MTAPLPSPEQQIDRADVMAAELRDCGHDEITGLDLLDALASCGYVLAEAGGANVAYVGGVGLVAVTLEGGADA